MPTSQAARFESNFEALKQFAAREGHAAPAATHVETVGRTPVPLGTWVGYIRQRRRTGKLSLVRQALFDELPGWEWGPLRPGPTADIDRDRELRRRYDAGWTVRNLAVEYGVSRQRVHQILDATADIDTEEFV